MRHSPSQYGKDFLATAVDALESRKPHNVVARTQFGCDMFCGTEDLIQRYIYLFGVWEPHLTAWIQERLRPGDTFVDVGANVGYYTLLAASCVGQQGHIVAIEASPSIFDLLSNNVQRNEIGARVRSVNVAASDQAGTVSVYHGPKDNIGLTTTVPHEDFKIEATILALPLRDILTDEEMTSARLIKIDVEGLEGPVVRGLLPGLPSCREDLELVLEVNGQPTPQGEMASDIVGQLRGYGFNVYEITNSYSARSYVEAMDEPQRPQRIDGDIDPDESADLVFSRIDAPHL
jgi:FkbM family methyltransferase